MYLSYHLHAHIEDVHDCIKCNQSISVSFKPIDDRGVSYTHKHATTFTC